MTRTPSKIARRYAKALFESLDIARVDAVSQILSQLAGAWSESAELRVVLLNPSLPLQERLNVIGDVAAKVAEGDSLLTNFAKVLLENQRVSFLPDISVAFTQLVDILKKRLALEITSAFDLDQNDREAILQQVRADFGSLATIDFNSDSSLIGGLRIKAGDLVLDSSVSGALNGLRESLVS
jgi:F-type H+-transporting ATPase subunit delta